ncbi:MAG TPA: carbohydrate binding domain-containing protein [Lacipirellulaceae bacterium]
MGSVYIAVLGTSLIVALLALSALALQRIQNRMLGTSTDIRQAQLNAEAAVELGLLAMKQDTNWRTTYTSGHWITNRTLTAGTCSLDGTDPVDGNLANNTTDPVVFTGIGDYGSAEQRVRVTADPQAKPLSCLRSGVAAGHSVTLTGSVLRSSGLVSANLASASASTIYGNVQATSISGSTYAGTSTQISSSQLPTMPTWTTVFNYYKTNGSQLDISKMPTKASNLARNSNVEAAIGTNDWTGSPLGSSAATIAQSNLFQTSGLNSLKVSSRADYTAGAAQYISDYIISGQSYLVDCMVRPTAGISQNFVISLCTKGTGAAQTVVSSSTSVQTNNWKDVTAQLVAPSWSGNLAYAYVKISGASASNTGTFYVDDFTVREAPTGLVIYQQVLGPGVDNLYVGAPVNAQGIYWIDCSNNNLYISRSRIKGTLLVINPGTSSCIGPGPIRWSPAVSGYPALLVHADTATKANFSIQATNRVLSESENGVNYNPAGVSSEEFGQDTDMNETYSSEVSGLVAVENNLTYQNNGLIRGTVIVGNDLISTGGALEISYQPESLLNPPPGFTGTNTYVRRPASMTKTVLP